MGDRQQRFHGKYVPILKNGQEKLYLPLENYSKIDIMRASGYDVDDLTQHLIKVVQVIKDARQRRKVSEQKKQKFIRESLADFSKEVGSIDLICPYCLGKVNHNWQRDQGAVLCGWHDLVTSECSGNAFYTIDRANFVLGMPEVEKYTCPIKKTQLDLTIYDFNYLEDEVKWRSREIHKFMRGERLEHCDAVLSRIFPIRISIRRTKRDFKKFICSLIEKEAIDWLNTLAMEDLTSLLEKAYEAKGMV